MWVFGISFILLIVAGISKAVMDKINFHYYESVFKSLNKWFWNPIFSSYNKYKNHDPSQGAKFPFSTTILVWTTDAWHLFQMIFHVSLISAFTIPYSIDQWSGRGWIVFGILGYITYTLTFEVFFKKVFKKT